MKRIIAVALATTLFAGYEPTKLRSAVAAPSIDIWTAAAQGNIEAIKQHLEAGTDVDANIKTLAGDVTYSVDDRSLLAEFSAKAFESDAIKRMKID